MLTGELLKITKGKLVSGQPDSRIIPSKISTDSRAIKKGDFFIALKGPNFDGNNFILDAFKNGAVGAIIANYRFPRPADCYRRGGQIADSRKIIIQVKDTLKALQDIAHYHRMKFRIPVIAVTGSNGKTTVKEMIWAVLSAKYNVLKNEGTKNNHIGVPQTLLKLNSSHDISVLEMGANHTGEIRLLAYIARPAMSVITNIGPSHLEFFRNLDGVCKAKKEILEFLDKDGVAILNGDDALLRKIDSDRFKIIRFGLGDDNDYRATSISVKNNALRFRLNGKTEFELKLLGVHNIYNVLSAIAVGKYLDVNIATIKRVLLQFTPSDMRCKIRRIAGFDIINDAYNSNPLSMKCALETLEHYDARAKWVVSGDMLELGRQAAYFHKKVGESVSRSNVDGFLTFGRLSRHAFLEAKRHGMDPKRLWHCSSHEEAADILRRVAKKGDAILVKGSRAMEMERIMERL